MYRDIPEPLRALVEPVVGDHGFELVVADVTRGPSGSVVRVVIDTSEGDGRVPIDECARVSREIETCLDASDVVRPPYTLEVSSPGMDRPLRTAAEWRRFVGRLASVNSPALHGRQDVEILAVDGSDGAERVRVRDGKGREHEVALAEVTDARLAFRWDAKKPSR